MVSEFVEGTRVSFEPIVRRDPGKYVLFEIHNPHAINALSGTKEAVDFLKKMTPVFTPENVKLNSPQFRTAATIALATVFVSHALAKPVPVNVDALVACKNVLLQSQATERDGQIDVAKYDKRLDGISTYRAPKTKLYYSPC
jgi:hypothetical protein